MKLKFEKKTIGAIEYYEMIYDGDKEYPTGTDFGTKFERYNNITWLGDTADLTIDNNNQDIEKDTADGWDAQIYSYESFTGGCYLQFKVGTDNKAFQFGLIADAPAAVDRTYLDHSIVVGGGGTIALKELGVTKTATGSVIYSLGSLLEIMYRGTTVSYYLDKSLKGTTTVSADLNFQVQCWFNHQTSKFTESKFYP